MAELNTDAELLRRSRHDPDAFVRVCRRHASQLQRWLVSQTQNEDTAADRLAETLAEAWRVRRRFRDPGDGSARPWLFGIARNVVAESRRRHAIASRARERLRMRLEFSSGDPFADVDERLAGIARREELKAAIAQLPVEQQRALALRVIGERDYRELADTFAISGAAARTRVFRALGTIRARLQGGDR